MEIIESATESKSAVEEDLPSQQLKKGISATKEELEIIEEDKGSKVPKSSSKTDVDSDRKLQKGISATIETAETIEDDDEKPQKAVESNVDVDYKDKLKRGISAKKENIELIEEETSKSKRPSELSDASNATPSKAKEAVIENIKLIEADDEDFIPKKVKEGLLEKELSQKGKRDYGEEIDEKTEELLRKAQKQRSLVEDITEKPSKAEGRQQKFISTLHCFPS